MKRKQLLVGNIIGILLVVFVIVAGKISYSSFVDSFSESISGSQAIGIIGQADGPTAIFVSGGFDLTATALVLLLVLVLVGFLFFLSIIYLIRNK